MDHTLTREESKLLMELLGLPMEQYGNFPLMRKAFLQKCKIMHPDKGGDEQAAKMLISLYKKLESEVKSLNTDDGFSTEEVCKISKLTYMKDWLTCCFGSFSCKCLFCLLLKNHKQELTKKPKVWGDCLCFKCYTLWFGLQYTVDIYQSWQALIGVTLFKNLNI
ncbi:small T antigen [Saimiri sciureus polyomavirus 1]|uniref:Small t antigen n=1 Tax=Saimiri sciureus polyomavirus 1 TaxID=1236410 RepID=K7QLH6_9POLY|nr:small T antigen [Saimiri sciureus polyomavirus 1]AFU25619.1 small T antigen [Saimiri sciureus polyomavirus 1]